LPDNWVDIAILLVVAWHIADGVRRGFIGSLINLVGFVLSLIVSLTFYPQVADWASSQWPIPDLLAKPLAFGGLWILTGIVVSIVGGIVTRPVAWLIRGNPLDVLLSVVPSALKGLLVCGITLTILLAIPPLPAGMSGSQGFTQLREAIQVSQLAGTLVEQTAAYDRFAREVVGEPLSETLTMLTVKPEDGERVDLGFQIPNPRIDEAAEAQMFTLLNQERTNRGLNALTRDPAIDAVARAHSVEMLQQGYFAHDAPDGRTPFQRMMDGNVQFTMAGENIALAPTVTLAHQGLMNSPGHRANILRPEYRRVGIGAAVADGRGRMFSQDFAD
jgi:uncharacterized protein YkwD